MNNAPELTGIGKYTGAMVQGLLDRSHEVSIVCAPPYYPQWRVDTGYDGASYSVEKPRQGLTVVRCPVWVPRRPGGLKRLLHLASFALSSLPVMLGLAAWRPTVVLAVMPSMLAAPGALLAARLSGARSWLHVQDFEIDAAFELGLLQGQAIRQLVLRWERKLLTAFEQVTTISERMLNTLVAKGVAHERTELHPNGVDTRTIRPLESGSPLRRELGIRDGQRVCLYAGSMNRKQGLPLLIEAAHALQAREDIVFVLSGEGECKAELECAAAGLPNVRFQALCPDDRLNELLNLADIHLLPQLRSAADLVMPSKLPGMMASGRPVIASALPGTEVARVVAGRGLVVEPESAQALVCAITSLCDAPAALHNLGRSGRAFAQAQLDQTLLMNRLDAHLSQFGEPRTVGVPVLAGG